MASNSIAQSGVERNPRPLEKSEQICADHFKGTKPQLVAAGIVKDGQFPGDPGANKVMASYCANGDPYRRRRYSDPAPGSIHIRRMDRDRFYVQVTISEDERARREKADAERYPRRAEKPTSLEAAETAVAVAEATLQKAIALADALRNAVWVDPGIEVAEKRMLDASPARFRVGDKAIFWSEWGNDKRDGEAVEIIGAYELGCVFDKNGPYVDDKGDRVSYRWGYFGRRQNGEEFFYPAYLLRALDGSIRHLRLVNSDCEGDLGVRRGR